MKIVAQTDFDFGTKALIYGCAIGGSLLAVWDTADVVQKKNFGHLYFVSIPLLLGCVAGLIYLARHRLVLSETSLCQYGFRTKCIPLEDIESITEYLGSYSIEAGKTRIRITTDLQQKDRFKDQLIEQFKRLDSVRNAIPGQALEADYVSKLVQQIRHMADKSVETDDLVRVDSTILEQLVESAYYIVYEHPVHDFLHRAYTTETTDLKNFTSQYERFITTPGKGVWILPRSLEWFIFYEKDALLFYAGS